MTLSDADVTEATDVTAWFVYMIRCDDESLYTGITTNIERRFQQHATGTGAKYFNARSPRSVVYQECHCDRSSASRREAEIKKLTKKQKEQLLIK